MSRVNDALARRKAGGVLGENPATERKLVEVADELWPAERPVTPAHPEMASADILQQEFAAHPPLELALEDRRSTAGREAPEQVSVGKLVLNASIGPAFVEQYRRLAARLYLAQAEHGTRTVMVTSALVGEGKTLTASNLALTLSESYKKRVLLIDADLRRPGVHQVFQIPNLAGLNDGVRSTEERKVPVLRLTEHLSILTAGRPDPDPMSVLASERMRRVLADASRSFDWVILDTPPVALLSDAHLLASLVDTVVLVVKSASTPLRATRLAVEAVGRERIMGVVLNCADETQPMTAYEYYGGQQADIVAR